MKRAHVVTASLLFALACGGDEPPPPPAAARPATARPAAAGNAAKAGTGKKAPLDTMIGSDSTQLQREMFSYRGAGRDPFLSLMKSADLRPLLTDVRIAGITYDAAYPSRSVAVLRDTAQKKRYAVRAGDELGQMKITEIRPDQVVVSLNEFGVERQVVLQMRRRESDRGAP